MLAVLWLLLALMPLRAWAWSGMVVAMAAAPALAAESVALPPCHGAPAADADGGEAPPQGAVCALCLFCAPLLAAAEPAGAALPRPGAPPPAAEPGGAPEGALGGVFRPPRG